MFLLNKKRCEKNFNFTSSAIIYVDYRSKKKMINIMNKMR